MKRLPFLIAQTAGALFAGLIAGWLFAEPGTDALPNGQPDFPSPEQTWLDRRFFWKFGRS